jgi:ATP-dependent phosphofructokinase / diphosphate-dependent phosphofructokinase
MVKRIGILTSGGDCPGLNPAIKWVVKTALDEELSEERGFDFEVIGIRDGWRGLAKYDSRYPVLAPGKEFSGKHYARVLTEHGVRTWDRLGGTRLGTSRTNPYTPGKESWPQVVASYKELGLDALVAIGGEYTLAVTARLHREEGLNIVCIPKTIDRDLKGTDYSLGFETALGVIVEEIDRIRTTAHSHSRTFIIETMGRVTGHLALSGGLAAGADVILIPEFPFSTDRVVELLKAKREAGQRYAIVVVSEGANEATNADGDGEAGTPDKPLPGGIAKTIEKRVEQGTGGEVRSVVLSHLQRGGVPCAFDRRIARKFGIAAMQLIEEEKFGQMVVFRDGEFGSLEIPTILQDVQEVDVAVRYDTESYNARFSLA